MAIRYNETFRRGKLRDVKAGEIYWVGGDSHPPVEPKPVEGRYVAMGLADGASIALDDLEGPYQEALKSHDLEVIATYLLPTTILTLAPVAASLN